MFTSVALISIFSAIIIFFSKELSTYAKKLMDRPYIFLSIAIVILTICVEIYPATFFAGVLAWWILLLQMVQGLSTHFFGNFAEQLLAKGLIAIVFSSVPVMIAMYLDTQKRKRSLYNSDVIKKRGYSVALVLWLGTVLFFVLGLPSSIFSG